ncbi:hypothetical protein [Tomitella fengzijianii]|uniref:Uncharacterized protein n=1 Tax=Tomitella fengzijianii TaxID=2597660 RepID=A0A516WZB1_9ACTN|nr:hypothetical protein [Tomitella fengzijianii]QDQ96186.1 hypothetical protein FO059_01045 [Tomitella fengzijianii]
MLEWEEDGDAHALRNRGWTISAIAPGGGGGSSLVPSGGTGPTVSDAAPSVTIAYSTAPEPGCTGSLCSLFGSLTRSRSGAGS